MWTIKQIYDNTIKIYSLSIKVLKSTIIYAWNYNVNNNNNLFPEYLKTNSTWVTQLYKKEHRVNAYTWPYGKSNLTIIQSQKNSCLLLRLDLRTPWRFLCWRYWSCNCIFGKIGKIKLFSLWYIQCTNNASWKKKKKMDGDGLIKKIWTFKLIL